MKIHLLLELRLKLLELKIEHINFYIGNNSISFMNKNYEQIALQKDLINSPKYLKEGSVVDSMFHAENETPLSCTLPQNVNLKIELQSSEKGNTATNALKPATTETGAEVRVPLFINQGDTVKIDTSTGNYMKELKTKFYSTIRISCIDKSSMYFQNV